MVYMERMYTDYLDDPCKEKFKTLGRDLHSIGFLICRLDKEPSSIMDFK